MMGAIMNTNNKLNDDIENTKLNEDESLTNAFRKLKLDKYAAETSKCSYCLIDDRDSLVFCTVCEKWFCNGGGTTSHIINHLVRANHVSVGISGSKAIIPLKCCNCASKNVFELGFLPYNCKNIYPVVCKPEPENCKWDKKWDRKKWESLISKGGIHPKFCKIPPLRLVTAQKMTEIEKLLKNEIIERKKQAVRDQAQFKSKIRYENEKEYTDKFLQLIEWDADYNKKAIETPIFTNITIIWTTHKRFTIIFPKTISKLKLMEGDIMNISNTLSMGILPNTNKHNKKKYWSSKEVKFQGKIVELPNSKGEMVVDFLGFVQKFIPPIYPISGFTVQFEWNSTSHDRMKAALKGLSRFVMCNDIFQHIIGNCSDEGKDTNLPVPKITNSLLPNLNESQHNAVMKAIKQPFTLIQGPPGTGKTVTSATIVYYLVKMQKRVLVCGASNNAVDNLALKIKDLGLNVVRVMSRNRQTLESPLSSISLHILVNQISNGLFKVLHRMKVNGDCLTSEQNRIYIALLHEYEHKVLEDANVICTTCIGAGSYMFKEQKIDALIIDEATQATEPETLIPIANFADIKQVILVGDQCQLGPVVMCPRSSKSGLNLPLFERLLRLGKLPTCLDVQYRMHPSLALFPSNEFYKGMLNNGVLEDDRKQESVQSLWPNPKCPMIFLTTNGQEKKRHATTFMNQIEAKNVEEAITKLLSSGIKPNQIGVITPYEGQREYIVNHIRSKKGTKLYQGIEIANVDTFQGREKDYIILSCVRSNEKCEIGFLSDPRRLNVSLTRAKFGLIIIGNGDVLATQPLWNRLLIHFQEHSCLVEGSLSDLKQSNMRLIDLN